MESVAPEARTWRSLLGLHRRGVFGRGRVASHLYNHSGLDRIAVLVDGDVARDCREVLGGGDGVAKLSAIERVAPVMVDATPDRRGEVRAVSELRNGFIEGPGIQLMTLCLVRLALSAASPQDAATRP